MVADRTLAAAVGEAQQPVAPLPEGAPQKVHGVGVLREHHDLGVSVPRQLVQVLDQPSELAVRRQGGDPLQQAVYLPLFLDRLRLQLQGADVVGVRDLVERLVVGRVLFQGDRRFERLVAALLQRGAQRVEAAGEPAAVDGHHETDRGSLRAGGPLVGRRDVLVHSLVEAAFRFAHLDETVMHLPVRDGGRQYAGRGVLAQQLAGMPGDQAADGRVRQHDTDRRAALHGLQAPAGNARLVAQGAKQRGISQA